MYSKKGYSTCFTDNECKVLTIENECLFIMNICKFDLRILLNNLLKYTYYKIQTG